MMTIQNISQRVPFQHQKGKVKGLRVRYNRSRAQVIIYCKQTHGHCEWQLDLTHDDNGESIHYIDGQQVSEQVLAQIQPERLFTAAFLLKIALGATIPFEVWQAERLLTTLQIVPLELQKQKQLTYTYQTEHGETRDEQFVWS